MKKIVKLIAALGMLAMAFSFVGCDMATEDELNGVVEGGNTGGTGGNKGNGTAASTPLWSMFEGADLQVWEKTADLTPTKEGLEIKIGSLGWWGVGFCNAAGVGPSAGDVVTFDMSEVASISFEAKASENASMWVSCFDQSAGTPNPKVVNISTSYETKTVAISGNGRNDYGVLTIGGNNETGTTVKTGVRITIKNVKFLNSAGTEITPKRNK